MRVCVLGSGSRGNCTLVEAAGTTILIDAGFSGREISRRLERIGRRSEDIAAVLITHEHNDHISGAGIISRQARVPLFANSGTYRAAGHRLGKLSGWREFGTGEHFTFDGLHIHPFAVSHDTADPVGFVISDGRCTMGYCTDTGKITSLIAYHLRKCDLLVLESNHDPKMLREGPYPFHLQQRVRSSQGHLANEDAGRFLCTMVPDYPRYVVLAHLSETNNRPDLALASVRRQIKDLCPGMELLSAGQNMPTCWINLGEEREE